MAHLEEAGHRQVIHKLQLGKLQLTRVAGEQQLPAHLRLLDHGDLDLPGVLLEDELVPQERGAGRKHYLVTRDLQLVDAHVDITEAFLVSQEVHLLQHGVPKSGEVELQDHLILGHHEPRASSSTPVKDKYTAYKFYIQSIQMADSLICTYHY